MKKMLIGTFLFLVFMLVGCGNSIANELDDIRRLAEGIHESEYSTTMQTISYKKGVFTVGILWLPKSNGKQEKYSYSFKLKDLDYELMKSNSMFIEKSLKEVWINCKAGTWCLTNTSKPGKKFESRTMKIKTDDRIGFINKLHELM